MSRPTCSPDLIQPVLTRRALATPEYRADLGHSQRMLQTYSADPDFRVACQADPGAAARGRGLQRHPEDLRPLWDSSLGDVCVRRLAADPGGNPSLRRYAALLLEKVQMRRQARRDGAPAHSAFRAWRERQIQRCTLELSPIKADQLIHAPFTVELGRGCSVGCWFCGVSAGRLSDQWPHTPANARLWRECLQVLQELLGEPAARQGFCYWGTDPLDNPDYEEFLCDLNEVLGSFPQTSTAQPQKHVERVRRLIKLSDARGGQLDRFSVLTLRHWRQIFEAFDPAELAFVEGVPQNQESLENSKTISGRALERNRARAGRGLEVAVDQRATSTIACVSGFLLRMVDRTVQVITPCNASDRWPLGYRVLGHGVFSDALSLRRTLLELIAACMPGELANHTPVRFRPDLEYLETEDGFILRSYYIGRRHRGTPALVQLGRYLAQGGHDRTALARHLEAEHGQSWAETFACLHELFERGYLDEEPDGN